MISRIELATENDKHKRKLKVVEKDDGNFLFLTEGITSKNDDDTYELGMMSVELTRAQVATLADVLQRMVL